VLYCQKDWSTTSIVNEQKPLCLQPYEHSIIQPLNVSRRNKKFLYAFSQYMLYGSYSFQDIWKYKGLVMYHVLVYCLESMHYFDIYNWHVAMFNIVRRIGQLHQ
jgi:hypothetical protein